MRMTGISKSRFLNTRSGMDIGSSTFRKSAIYGFRRRRGNKLLFAIGASLKFAASILQESESVHPATLNLGSNGNETISATLLLCGAYCLHMHLGRDHTV